jgi:hypothetical protein
VDLRTDTRLPAADVLAIRDPRAFLDALTMYVMPPGATSLPSDDGGLRYGVMRLCEFWVATETGMAYFLGKLANARYLTDVARWAEVIGAVRTRSFAEDALALFPDRALLADDYRREMYVLDVLEDDEAQPLLRFDLEAPTIAAELADRLRSYLATRMADVAAPAPHRPSTA